MDAFYAGMAEAAAPHGVTVVGGDTSAAPGGWTVNVTLLGIHPGEPRLRSHARAGDAVAVTGSLGASAAGLHALELGLDRARDAGVAGARARRDHAGPPPAPRACRGGTLAGPGARRPRDDGLLRRPRHGPRAHLPGERGRRPRAPRPRPRSRRRRARRRARSGATPREWAVSGGEDYELLLTCDPAAADRPHRGPRRGDRHPAHRDRTDRGGRGRDRLRGRRRRAGHDARRLRALPWLACCSPS